MKSLIIAADAATPEYIIGKKEQFPTIQNIIKNGAVCTFSSYVQKGYEGSYSSEQNWASIYTGLSPREHNIDRFYRDGKLCIPSMVSFADCLPFWQILNESGLSVALWSADCCEDPVEIDGYAVSSRYTPIQTPSENREAPREIMVCEKDRHILRFLDGTPPPRLYPPTIKSQGFTYRQLKENPALVDKIANERVFQPMVDNFESELRYWFSSMAKAQREYPVDIMYLFTPTPDILGHFVLYCDENPVLIEAYKLIDFYIGEFVREFKPELTVFMSDHGQQNFKNLIKCADPKVQKEAFAARDEVIWMENGSIAFEALNGGLLFAAHSIKGVFLVDGSGIKKTGISEMRTLDIYPTLLEMFDIKVPAGRNGYVVDIFTKPIVNTDMVLKARDIVYRNIALVQTHEISVMDIILNELYLEKRFSRIIVAGERRYEEIFRNNPRVFDFVDIDSFDGENYNEVYCGFYNGATKRMTHLRVNYKRP